MAGYIKLHRGWHDSAQFTAEPYCERAAWCWLLTNAAWKDTVQRNHRGEVVAVSRGQYRASLKALAVEWQWSIKRVRTFLNALEKCGSIGKHGAQSGTIITICKYSEYQSSGHEAGTQETPKRARSGHIKEEGKEREEEKKDTRGRAVSCPDDVSTEVWADFLAIRKAKRAPLTETAWKGFLREAGKAGLSVAAAVEYAVVKNWQTFNADWWRKAEGETLRRNNGWIDKDGYELPYA